MGDFKQLVAWRKGVELCGAVYSATAGFPPGEQFGLTSQMRRAVVSIPSNLAEGHGRGTSKEYKRFCHLSLGSTYELETQVIIARNLRLLDPEPAGELHARVVEVRRIIEGLCRSLDD